MLNKDPIVIVSAARTPIGNFQGCFKDVTAPELGTVAIKAVVERAQLKPETVDEVLMGCVLPAGLGQAPARQAALGAELPLGTVCTTVNKMCGSGMKTVMMAHDILCAGSQQVVVAGGMESMTNAPYLLPKARAGYRLGHQMALDHMFYDGLEDAYQKGNLMGVFADNCAQQLGFSRQSQDAFALASLERAQTAAQQGLFTAEIVPVMVKSRREEIQVTQDEGPMTARADKIPQLKPAFKPDGTVTAANSSSISDGAAALMLMRRSTAEKYGLTPLATIVGQATYAQAPALFPTAPIGAVQKLLQAVDWSAQQVDLYEINEAFAVVPMAVMQELQLPHEKINVHGGACVLGHPIGESGARIVVTLLYALKQRGLTRGVATLCIGGGEATALAIEI